MTRPSTHDLRARSVLAGEASTATAELEAALATPPVSRTAAFLDIDNTMLCGASVYHLVEVARLLAIRLTGALGTVAAERDGVYTGELVGYPCAVNPDSRLRRHAELAGWRIRDYRTGRKAARLGLLTAGALGVTLSAVSAAMAIRKRVS
jgi:hypothetical protein